MGAPRVVTRPEAAKQLETLRSILLGPERARLDALEAWAEDPERRREEVETAFERLLVEEPGTFTRHLVPIFLPLLRAAVVSQLRAYLQSIEAVVEQTLTLRALRWRWTSFRTGTPIGELALSDSTLSRVDQLLLVHRHTGLPVGHACRPEVPSRDVDVVSGLVSAIGSFAREAFSGEGARSGELEQVAIGERELWLLPGRWITLVASLHGVCTPRVRQRLTEALERVERQEGPALSGYSGEPDLPERIDPVLEPYLDVEARPPARWARWTVALVVLLLVGAGVGWLLHERARRAELERWVDAQDHRHGVVVVARAWRDGALTARLLVDPAVELPASPDGVALDRAPFLSLDPQVVLRRVRRSLAPPADVRMALQDGTLTLSGSAPLDLRRRARTLGPTFAGVTRVDVSGLRAAEAVRLEAALAQLESTVVPFPVGRTEPTDRAAVDALATLLDEVATLVERTGADVRLVTTGGADPTGTAAINRRLATGRARWLARFVARRGLPSTAAVDGIAETERRSARIHVRRAELPE